MTTKIAWKGSDRKTFTYQLLLVISCQAMSNRGLSNGLRSIVVF